MSVATDIGFSTAPSAAAQIALQSVTLSVPGLNCAGCIGKVERALAAQPGVQEARANLTLKRVTVRSGCDPQVLTRCLSEIGFEAYPLDPGALGAQKDAKGRDLILRLGVAGFAMMNVMLLSVAVWSGAADATRDLFHLLSAAIAVPTVAYSGQPFFRNALSALRVAKLNMDVPISLAIILATGMSVFESLNGGSHAYFDAGLSLTFFLLIGRFLDHRTRATARSAARELSALEVQTAQKLVAGRAEPVACSDLVPGDRVLVASGTRVPVDGCLISEQAVTDRSFLTGESAPVGSASGDTLRAGEINLGPALTLEATAVGDDTTLRQLAQLIERAENARSRYTGLADRAAQIYAPAVHLLALAAFLGWLLVSGDARLSLNIAIAVLIITCPCALGLAVPAVSTAAIGKLYEMGFLIKSDTALERLAEVDHVVFDKTGTLTEPGVALAFETLAERDKSIIAALAQHSNHPVSRVLSELLASAEPVALEQVREIAGQGVAAIWQGQQVFLGKLPGHGLAFRIAERVVPLEQTESLRSGAETAVAALRDRRLALTLLSGDRRGPVARIAATLGLADYRAGCSPQDKHDRIAEITASGARVAMIGDGLNDTAALAQAYASIAPSSALDASRNAADILFLRNRLDDLPHLFETARQASRLSRQNFAIAAGYNAIAIPIALLGYATPLLAAIAMSVSSITVLVNAMRVRRS